MGIAESIELRVGDSEELEMGPDPGATVEEAPVELLVGSDVPRSSEVEVDESVERVL